MKVGGREGNRGAVVYNMLTATVYIIFFFKQPFFYPERAC
jgi:hypothetical protein